MEAVLTSKGQATIPKAIRDHLGLQSGDRVKFFIHPDGCVVLLPKRPVTALRGMLAKPGVRRSLADMDQAIAAGTSGAKGTRRRKS